jgi:Ca-activated chloride channel family protein
MRNCAAVVLAGSLLFAQNHSRPVFRDNVQMVVLPFSVTDSQGRSISGLTPADIRIFENGAPQRIAAFFEGDTPVLSAEDRKDATAGASIFVLFDTSNRMYRMFPYVYDAIAGFVRRLDPADSVAIYTFSRNLSRAARLTNDHALARAGLTNAVAGDDTALFNALLLTLRDAAKVPGRKAIVMFSNGPDNASMVGPDDVCRVAEDEGIPVYIVSTLDASKEPQLAHALRTLTERSGGKMYWAARWQDQARTFESVRQDIRSSYTAYYYPAPDTGPGYRHIQVKIASGGGTKWHVRARAGYEARGGGPERSAAAQ